MVKKRVLVFPCGSEIGLEIHKSLQFSTHFTVYGGSSVDDHGLYVFENYIPNMPFIGGANFSEGLKQVVSDYKIDFIIPAHDDVALVLAEIEEAGGIGAKVVGSSAATNRIARSKQNTYSTLKDTVKVPTVFKDTNEIKQSDYPVFLKPDIGQGSKGAVAANDSQEVAFYLKKNPELLVMEHLPGKEFTVDCFTDKYGNLLVSEGRERTRINNGISVNSSMVHDDRFKKLAQAINNELTFRGVWFFQVKEDAAGELVLMEVATRVAGTMGLIRCRGLNLVLLSLFDAQGYDVSIFNNSYSLTIDRALHNTYSHDIDYQHVYLDLDDTVILDGKVNPLIMAFVYQCLNQQKQIHLITRHKEDLQETLKQHHLVNIFDSVIWVQEVGAEKWPHITEKNAIFVDDSFAERKKVHDHCKIPTFDVHMIESLLEKF